MIGSHKNKINAAKLNDKLCNEDLQLILELEKEYIKWRKNIDDCAPVGDGRTEADVIRDMVMLLGEYRLYLDVEVMFDGGSDFLYRQKGQMKLDNSVIEEFLPALASKVLPGIGKHHVMGPTSCFAAAYFDASLSEEGAAPRLRIKSKDQDFAIARKAYLASSYNKAMTPSETVEANLGLVCAECKTNLDKTMFQEAAATAHDLKMAVPGSRYYVLCEWLDMTPVSTATTDIDEVLLLRQAKRLSSNVRSAFGSVAGRRAKRKDYEQFLVGHPFKADIFQRLVSHWKDACAVSDPNETDVLRQGFF